MRVLLDECVPRGIRRYLVGHAVRSVQTLGWSGMPDDRLLADADGRFDVVVTTDVRLASDRDLAGRSYAVVLLRGRRSSLRGLAAAAALLPGALAALQPGTRIQLGEAPTG